MSSLKTTSAIIEQLERALRKADHGEYEHAKIIVVACKHALQAHALDFMKRRKPIDAQTTEALSSLSGQ